jgi:diadenosine tetraphosphate (Ap4A) HIT family hydrolase
VKAATAIHALVERCGAGDYAPTVGRLRSGWVVMGMRQVLPGYCLLLPDPVVADLNALQGDDRHEFMLDMGLLGDALKSVTGAVRINYAIFGNVEPALHVHLFPRHADEPVAIRSAQPWALDWDAAPSFSTATHGAFKDRLMQELQRRRMLR